MCRTPPVFAVDCSSIEKISSPLYEEFKKRLLADWHSTVRDALEELISSNVLTATEKESLLTLTLQREFRIFLGEIQVQRYQTYCEIGLCLKGLMLFGHLSPETKIEFLKPFLASEKLCKGAIRALSQIPGFDDEESESRIEIFLDFARGKRGDNFHDRAEAIRSMKTLTISNSKLKQLLLPNIVHIRSQLDVAATADVLFDRGEPDEAILMYLLPAAHPHHKVWQFGSFFLDVARRIASRKWPDYPQDIETVVAPVPRSISQAVPEINQSTDEAPPEVKG